MDMRFGNSYSRSLRPGSVKTVARELLKYRLENVRAHEVGWDKEALNKYRNIFSLSKRKRK
jgi:hypothetical protein